MQYQQLFYLVWTRRKRDEHEDELFQIRLEKKIRTACSVAVVIISLIVSAKTVNPTKLYIYLYF